MKKLLTLLALCCLMVTGAWAQTVVATMQQLVDAASTKTATVSPFYTTSVTGGAVYSFTGNGGNSGTYIGGITNDAVDAAFTGSKIVTVAAWVYGRPNGCIFGYGDEQTGVKFMLSTSGTNTTFKTTTKGKLDFTSVNFTLQEDAWNLVAFSVYGKASSTSSYRYYYGTTNGNYSTKTDKTMSTMNAASKFAIGSGNQGSAREVFSSDIANLTVITSDDYLNNPDIASLVGAVPTAVSHNYETYADGEFTYGPLNGNTWSAWSGSIPAELSALGSTYNATNLKVIEKYYTFAESGELSATFNFTSGQNRLDIAGIQVFSSTGVQIGADFHVGKAGNPSANNGYSVFIPEGGSYIVRYISTANCGSEQNIDTNGKVENAFVSGDFPVQDGKTYYIYNANNNDVKTYLHPSGTGLGLSTTCYEEPAYMWTCVKNGAYYNFRNVATGKWLGFKEVSNGAYNFKLKIVDSSKGYVTLYSVDQGKYMLVNNDGSKFDQSTLAENNGWSSKYGFTECSVSNLYFSESFANAKWMRVANSSNTGYVMTVKDGDAAGSNLHTDATDAAAEGQLFAFVGNQENGFVIYNKKLGNTYTLTAADTNQGTAATWVLDAETPTKWYLDETHINASSQPGYGITTSSASGGNSLNMHGGNGGDAKFYANGAGNGGSRWQFSLVDGTPTVIHYVVSGTKAHNDANNYVGVLNITKGTFLSNTYVGTDVNGKTFNAYLPKTQEPISISNTKLHGWNYSLTGSDGNYTVTYTAEQTDYQYLAFDKSAQWYRIPAIAKASNGDLVAIYDYRVCHNDVGFGEVDQVMRRSTDGGVTWSEETKIADGNGGGNHFGAAYGDPALVADRESNNMTLITVSGQQSYPGATATSRPMVAALFSSDNGQHWSDPVDITSQFWGSKGAMFQDEDTEAASTTFAYSGFFGSGKILQSRKTKINDTYRLYAAMLCRGKNVSGAYVVYSDDMGRNWSLLGGDNSKQACSGSDEPKVEELPDGSIVLSGRKYNGRYFNVWKWTTEPTKENPAGVGSWGTDVQSNQQTGGISVGGNSCNGEILLVDVTNKTTGQPAKLMLQSLPAGNDRSNVEIWYKDVTDASAYSSVSTFASNWTKGLQVSTTSSAYSTMTVQKDGKIGFFYEEGPATYCMVYVPLTIEKITNNAYEKVAEDIPTAEISLDNTTVTSSQLSELSITFTGANAAQVQLSATQHTAYLTPKASTPAQVKAQNGKFKAAGETPASIEGNISATDETGKFSINFGDADIAAGDYELTIPEGTFLVGTTPVPVLKANYTVEEPAPIPTAGRVYTIKAHFSDKTDLYLTSNPAAENLLLPMPEAPTANQSYWVAEASGNNNQPWKFKSGYGYAMSLTESNPGLTTGGTAFSVSANSDGTYCLVDGSNLYIGTWGANDDGHKGFGSYGAGGNCWKTGGRNSASWTTDYEIVEVTGVKAYLVSCDNTNGGVAPKFSDYAGVATVKNGGYIIVPNGTTLDATNFPAAEISGYTGSVTFNGTTITVTYEATTTPEGFHIYESNGTYSNTNNQSDYKDKWLSKGTNPQFTILVTQASGSGAANNMYHNETYKDSGILCFTGDAHINYKSTMTVSVQNGYKITGYTFKVKNLEGTTSGNAKVVTTAGQTINTTAANQTVEVRNLEDVTSFTITLDGSNGSRNEGIVFTDFYVTYEGEPVVEVPATGFYYIYDNNKSGYLYNNSITSEGTSELTETLTGTKVAYDNRYLWYVVSDGSSTSITLTNGQGTGYKVSDADETHTIDLESVNWKFEELEKVHILKTDTYEYPAKFVKVRYCSYAERENVLEEGYAIYKRSTPDQYAYNNGFFVNDDAYWTVGDDVSAVFGYGDMSSINHPEDNLPFTQCRIFTRADEIENAFHFYYYTQQDAERYLKIIDNYYQVFYEHVGDPGYCKELNEDYVDESGLIDAISEMMQYFGQMGEEYKMTREEIIASAEMWLGEMLEPFEAKYSLGRLNDYIKTLEIAPPVQGEAYRIAVRGNDYTGNTKYYLKNDGTYTANEAEADVFVLGGSGNETCGSLLVTNNNPGTEGGIHYLQVRADGVAMNTEYKEADNALNLVSMTKAEGENIQSSPAYLYGTFSATNKNGKVLTFDETGGGSWISDAESLYMKDNKTSAIELIPVEYPYNKPKFAVGSPDDHNGGYASIWLPFPMVFPEGVEAYRATSVENDGILILTKVNEDTNTVAAGGYILYTPEQTTDTDPDNLPLVLPAPADPEDVTPCEDNAFVGSTENPLVVKEEGSWATFKAKYEGTPYVLAKKNEVIGYYKYRDTETYLPKGKAIWFSNYKADSSAECLRFTFEEVISAIEALHGNTDNAEIYDLQGHRLNKVEKGQVNVINGKKVMFK